jgi:hypothetical protein
LAPQTYGGILGLAPFPLWRLEAAVAPGPTRLQAPQPAPSGNPKEKPTADARDSRVRARRKRDADEVRVLSAYMSLLA